MSVKLTWSYLVDDDTSTKIYRSLSPISEENLPEPIATVGEGVREFTDNTTEMNKVYFYRLGKITEHGMELTDNKSVYSSKYRGPGPQELIAGNYHEFGLFGLVDAKDFFTTRELEISVGLSTSGSGAALSARDSDQWVKIFIDGKVKYVRLQHTSHRSWLSLYLAGILYETTEEAEEKVPSFILENVDQGLVEQGKKIIRGMDVFTLHAPKGIGPGKSFAEGYNNSQYNGSEFNRIFYRLAGILEPDRDPPMIETAFIYPDSFNIIPVLNATTILCQEIINPSGTTAYVLGRELSKINNGIGTVGYNANQAWYPIITYHPNA